MRSNRGGMAPLAAVIADDWEDRETGLHQPPITGLADWSASALACRSVHASAWRAV